MSMMGADVAEVVMMGWIGLDGHDDGGQGWTVIMRAGMTGAVMIGSAMI